MSDSPTNDGMMKGHIKSAMHDMLNHNMNTLATHRLYDARVVIMVFDEFHDGIAASSKNKTMIALRLRRLLTALEADIIKESLAKPAEELDSEITFTVPDYKDSEASHGDKAQ